MKLPGPRDPLGGLTVGTLDLIDAFVFFGLRSGAQPVAILHSIAAEFVGRDAARAGGTQTAILGCSRTTSSRPASSRSTCWPAVSFRCYASSGSACGIAFGVVAYFVMTWFVVPMSNAGNHQITFALPATPIMINGILIHMFGVGLPAAYFASRT
jgi:hypothetical protein